MYQAIQMHQTLKSERSAKMKGKKFLMGFLYFVAIIYAFYFILAGFFADVTLMKFFPGQDALKVMLGFIPYLLATGLSLRLSLQNFEGFNLRHYLHLPIPKSELARNFTLKTVLEPLNLIPLLFHIPFAIKTIAIFYDYGWMIPYLIMVTLFSVIVHLTVLQIKFNAEKLPWLGNGVLGLIGVIAGLDYFSIIPVRSIFGETLLYMIQNSWTLLFLIAIVGALSFATYRFLLANAYVDGLLNVKEKVNENLGLFGLERFFQRTAHYMTLEIKLMLRNKRAKNTLTSIYILSPIMLVVFFLVDKDMPGQSFNYYFMLLYAMASLAMTHGQFMLGWSSTFFDKIFASPIDMKEFLEAKFNLYVLASTVVFAVALIASLIIDIDRALIIIGMYFYTIGFNNILIFFVGIKTPTRLEIGAGSAFNMQGSSFKMILLTMLVMFIPIIMILVLSNYIEDHFIYVILIGLGILGILTKELWLKWMAKQFLKKKHVNASIFRSAK